MKKKGKSKNKLIAEANSLEFVNDIQNIIEQFNKEDVQDIKSNNKKVKLLLNKFLEVISLKLGMDSYVLEDLKFVIDDYFENNLFEATDDYNMNEVYDGKCF